MAELESKRGVTDVPLPSDEAVGEDLSLLEDVLPTTPDGLKERLGALDFKNHRKAIAVLGLAAVAVGVGVYAAKHRGENGIFVRFADRRAQQDGVISLGEIKQYGAAIAVPVGEEGLKHLEQAGASSKVLFAMTGEPGEVVYESASEPGKYAEVAQRAAGWLMGHFSAQAGETK